MRGDRRQSERRAHPPRARGEIGLPDDLAASVDAEGVAVGAAQRSEVAYAPLAGGECASGDGLAIGQGAPGASHHDALIAQAVRLRVGEAT